MFHFHKWVLEISLWNAVSQPSVMLITFHCAVLGLRMIQYSEPDGQVFLYFLYHISQNVLPFVWFETPI